MDHSMPTPSPDAVMSVEQVVKDFAPIWGPIVGGLFGWFAARSSRSSAEAKEAKAERASDQKERLANEVAIAESTNKRFQTLMDGYEQRIGDLTNEVHGLREEVKSLRKALDERARMCVGCPRFGEMEAMFSRQAHDIDKTP
jgi:hypothetical protein